MTPEEHVGNGYSQLVVCTDTVVPGCESTVPVCIHPFNSMFYIAVILTEEYPDPRLKQNQPRGTASLQSLPGAGESCHCMDSSNMMFWGLFFFANYKFYSRSKTNCHNIQNNVFGPSIFFPPVNELGLQ